MGFADVRTFESVPIDDGEIALSMEHAKDADDVITVDPWPFSSSDVFLRCEAKRLAGTFSDQGTMRTALADADPVSLRIRLRAAT
jgi:hypothetical protein